MQPAHSPGPNLSEGKHLHLSTWTYGLR